MEQQGATPMQEYDSPSKIPGSSPFETRDAQHLKNEACFTGLKEQFENSRDEVAALDDALGAARQRMRVLEASMEALNAPAQAPSIR